MKLIQPKVEYLPQASGLEGIYKQIELAGRTCYRSEDKIIEDSAKPFVDRMITASEIVVTGFASDWKHFFDLRLFGKTGNPHPNMVQLAELIKTEAEKAGIWDDIMSKPSKFD